MIKVNELYYPVEVDVTVKAPSSGHFKYDHFDKYGDRIGECDWTPNNFAAGVKESLQVAIADQAAGTATAWNRGNSTFRLALHSSASNFSTSHGKVDTTAPNRDFRQSLTPSGSYSDGGVTWSGRAENFQAGSTYSAQNRYPLSGTATIMLYLGVSAASTTVAYTDITGISNVLNGDSFDLSYTISFTFSTWFKNQLTGNNGFFSHLAQGNVDKTGHSYIVIGNGNKGPADRHALTGNYNRTGQGTATQTIRGSTQGNLLSSAIGGNNAGGFDADGVNGWGYMGIGGGAAAAGWAENATAAHGAPWFKSSEQTSLNNLAAKRLQVTVNWSVT